MEKQLWFKAKRFGWGWYPCTWQGWAILAMYIFALTSDFVFVDMTQHSASDTLMNFFPNAYILTVFLIIICYAKGEEPKWQFKITNDELEIKSDNTKK